MIGQDKEEGCFMVKQSSTQPRKKEKKSFIYISIWGCNEQMKKVLLLRPSRKNGKNVANCLILNN